jgi:Resolvase, N terminal domain
VTVQREEIERWISANGAVVGELFIELGQCGRRSNRPVLIKAIERVEQGASDGIAVARLSSFTCSLWEGISPIARVQNVGGTLVSVDLGTDVRRAYLDMARREAIERGIYRERRQG